MTDKETPVGRGSHLVFQNKAKNIPRQDFMVMNISCKFEKASYIFFVRAVTVKSLYTESKNGLHEVLWRSVDDIQ